jgi:hypothetical protein
MLPPSLAFAWLLWRRYHAGFVVVLGFLLAAVVVSAVLPPYCSEDVAIALFGLVFCLSVPMLAVYLLLIFAYGAENADVLARDSCFPTGLFRLPVPAGSLVVWPIAYGAAAAIFFWLIVIRFVVQPWLALWNEEVPLWWGAAMATAALAWVQALLWSPFGLRGLRLFLLSALPLGLMAVTWFSGYVARFLQGDQSAGASEGVLVTAFAALTLLAWLISYVGVKHARRGNVPYWGAILGPLSLLARGRNWLASWLGIRHSAFGISSHVTAIAQCLVPNPAARAQVWLEWRLTGPSLPIMVGMMLPAVLMPLLFGKNDAIPVAQTVLSALAIPVCLAGLAGGWPGRRANRWVKDRTCMMPFIATLPLPTASMVRAMLQAAVLSTLATWALVLAILPVAIILTGNLDEAAVWWRRGLEEHQPVRIVVGTVAVGALLLVWTWKRMVDSLYLGLTGRKWIEASIALVCIPGSLALCVGATWIYKTPETHKATLAVLPWVLATVIVCRLLLALFALRQVVRNGLLAPPTVARWLAIWLLFAAALFGLLALSVLADRVAMHYLAFAVLSAMPMARLAATPLALAWNRHR